MRPVSRHKKSHRKLIRYSLAVIVLAVIGASSTAIYMMTRPANASDTATASTFTYDCKANDPESLPCLEQQYKAYTQKNGVTAAFTKLKAAYKTDPNVVSDCHQITHAIGRQEADEVSNVDDAYSVGDNFCWSGYYHGVMESIVLRIGIKNIDAALPNICASIKAKKPYSFDHYNCVHGLGHGIMNITGSDLFKSLKMCDLLTDNWEQESCYGGVFMENEMDEINPDHHTKYLNNDPMYPCDAVAEKYKNDCYLTQTSHALRLANYNFSTVFTECKNIEATYVDTCYQSLGRDASGDSSSDVAQTKASCMLGQDLEAQTNCVIGAVKDFVSYYHSDVQANNLCLALDSSLQGVCQDTKTSYYATF